MKKLIILMAMMSFLLIGIVFATIGTPTLRTPTTGSTLGKGAMLNVSFTSDTNMSACVIQAMSSSTANSSWSIVINITNTSDISDSSELGDLNATFDDTYVLEDAPDYSFRAICYNSTGDTEDGEQVTSATVTGVIVDRTRPTAPTTTHTSGTEFDDVTTSTVTYSVTDSETTSCGFAFLLDGALPRATGTNTFAGTYSGSSCTYTITKAAIPDGSYDVYAWAFDGTNRTYSQVLDFKVKTMEGGGTGTDDYTVDLAETAAKQTQMKQAGFVIVLILILYFGLFKKNKK